MPLCDAGAACCLQCGHSGGIAEILLVTSPMLFGLTQGTVPVVELVDGTVLEESRDVMQWALGQNDPAGWLIQHHAPTDSFIP